MEKVLQESEEKYRLLFEHAGEAIFVVQDGKVGLANPMTVTITGYSGDEIASRPFVDFIHADDRDMVRDRHARRLKGESLPPRYSFRVLHKDGGFRWVELSAVTIDWNGRPATLNFLRDITRRKEAEDDVQKLASIVRRSSELINLATPDGKMTFLNEAGGKMLGIDPEEVNKYTIRDVLPDHLLPMVQTDILPTLMRGDSWEGGLQYRNIKTGKLTDVYAMVFTIQNPAGKMPLLFANVSRDVTKRKQAEEDLRSREEHLRSIFENADEIIHLIAWDGTFLDISPSWERYTGFTVSETVGKSFVPYVHPDDQAACLEVVKRVYETGQPHKISEFRVKHASGKWIWFMNSGTAVKDDQGNLLYFSGVATDITERKQAEEEVQKANTLLNSIVENIPDMLFLKDAKELRFTRFNRAGEELLGHPRVDLLGKNDYDFFPKEQADFFTEKDREVLRGKEIVDIPEEPIQTRDKGARILHTKKVPILNANGEPEYLMGISEDITDRKSSIDRMRKALGGTVRAIVSIVESKDPYTAGHQRRVADISRAIATEMGLSADRIEGIRMAGIIHDIGKISVPTEILSMPRKLTDMEFSLIQTHAQSGYDILKDIEFPWPIARIVLEHHERMDGSGYPNGLAGDQVLPESRIMAVADVVEAMATHRPYRPSLGLDKALEEITLNRGLLYDAEAVDACLRLFREKGYKIKW